MILTILDFRTLSITLGIVIEALGLSMLSYVAIRKTYLGFNEWTIAILAMGPGLVLTGMRGGIPDFISICIANSLICSGMSLYYEGIRKHLQKKSFITFHVPAVFLITGLLLYYFYEIHPSVNARISLVSFICALYFLMAFLLTTQSKGQKTNRLNILLMVSHLGMFGFLTFRGVYFFMPSHIMPNYMVGGTVHALILLVIIVLMIFFIAALIQMNAYKLEMDLIQKTRQAKDNEEKFRLLSEQAMLSIAVIQESGFKYFNDAFRKLTGYSEQELLAMDFEKTGKIFHPDYRDFAMEQGRKKIAGETQGTISRYIYKGIRKSGEEKWVEQFSKSVLWEGKPADFMTQIDITSQKQAEEELRESEEKYRVLVENASDAVIITQGGRFLFANPAIQAISGYSAEELLNVSFYNLVHPEDRDMVLERHYQRLNGKNPPASYSFRFHNKDGELKWAQLNTARVNWEGENAILSFLRDTTRQQKLEIQVQQAHKMEAIGTLSGGIAHEFNNLLGIIVGNAEMALDDIPPHEPVREFIQEIMVASQRGEEVVRQLMSVNRPSMPKRVAVDIPTSIKETMGLLRASIPTSITFQESIAIDCHTVLGDPTQIRQVIINLCTNAFHAMEGQSGTLVVKAVNVESQKTEVFFDQELPPGKYLSLEVSDNGPGIPQEIQNRIFDPFYTTKDVGKGSGMGLSVVLGIMKGHEGGIRFNSQPGQGTTVQCFFPSAGTHKVSPPNKDDSVPGGTESILYVDDEKSIAKVAKLRLERLGYTVVAETDPQKALHIFEKNREQFDLVITDLTMPDITGDKLIGKLKEISPLVKTIICSGYSETIDAQSAEEMGAGAFLVKPTSRQILAATIRQVLDGH